MNHVCVTEKAWHRVLYIWVPSLKDRSRGMVDYQMLGHVGTYLFPPWLNGFTCPASYFIKTAGSKDTKTKSSYRFEKQ